MHFFRSQYKFLSREKLRLACENSVFAREKLRLARENGVFAREELRLAREICDFLHEKTRFSPRKGNDHCGECAPSSAIRALFGWVMNVVPESKTIAIPLKVLAAS